VTGRLPEFPVRMVLETLVGAGTGLPGAVLRISRDGRFTTPHFSPPAGVGFAEIVLP
jgi:hypothetical protein